MHYVYQTIEKRFICCIVAKQLTVRSTFRGLRDIYVSRGVLVSRGLVRGWFAAEPRNRQAREHDED